MNEMHHISFKRGLQINNLFGINNGARTKLMREPLYYHTTCFEDGQEFSKLKNQMWVKSLQPEPFHNNHVNFSPLSNLIFEGTFHGTPESGKKYDWLFLQPLQMMPPPDYWEEVLDRS